MLEKKIEAEVCAYARKMRVGVYKFVSPGIAGVPDRMFLYNGRTLFVEFKQAGKYPTPRQTREMARLRNLGFQVEVVKEIEAGKALVNELIREMGIFC